MNIIDPKPAPDARIDVEDDVWVPSACALCYGSCSLLAHRVDGTVIKLEGNPASAVGKGRLCGKGVSGLMVHYDPNRLTQPLKRTNPEKGMGVDPKWKEISWEEALDEIVGHLKRIRAEDPRKLVIQRTTTVAAARAPMQSFSAGFGTPNHSTAGGGLHCGNGAHLISGIMHASWGVVPDFAHCNYAIYFGASKGHSAGHASCSNMGLAADARARGMKMVVVDPMCNFAAAKASQWVPLRVGTDAALALALSHVVVHEIGTLDEPYLKSKTNGPYLIGEDGRYVRDPGTNKPLVWDEAAGGAVPFDQAEAENMALRGSFEVAGAPCRPAFELLVDHLEKFTPEWGEGISTVPAADIRRIAGEFVAEARIGSTIVVDGIELPYRPAAAIAFRGTQGHKNSVYNFLAVDILNQLVGACDVVGSCLGFPAVCFGHPKTGRPYFVPTADDDGLMKVGLWMGWHYPYPIGEPKLPQNMGLQDLFPMGMTSPFINSSDQEEMWEKFDLPYRPEMLLNFGTNLLMSVANKDTVAASLAKFKFIVSIDIFLNETSDFVDIVLPDCSYLQALDARVNFPTILSHPAGQGDWAWPIRQPVLPPEGEQRRFQDILIELAARTGFIADFNAALNAQLFLEGEYRLKPERKYSFEEICDNELKCNFGDDKDLDWFKENGLMAWPKKPEEVYWRPFLDVRVPIYWEWMEALGEKIAAIAEPRGLQIPRDYYKPLPDFLPCPSHECEHDGFDFYSFYYRDTLHTNSFTMENAWLDEAAQLDPFSYNIAMNADVGRARGLASGDVIRVETSTGRAVEGRVKLTAAIHPEGLGIAALCGHWSDEQPVAKGKGVFYNDLLDLDWHHTSPVNLNLDLCARVKVTKVTAAA